MLGRAAATKTRSGLRLIASAVLVGALAGGQVAAAAGPTLKLSGVMPDFGDIREYQVSPDGQFVVFTTDPQRDGRYELFSVPRDGSHAPLQLTDVAGEAHRLIGPWLITADSQRVVFVAGDFDLYQHGLFSVALTGGPVARLSSYSSYSLGSFTVSTSGQEVIYQYCPQDSCQLFQVPAAGGTSASLTPGLYVGDDFQLSTDGTAIVFRAWEADDDTQKAELYRVQLAGGPPLRLTEATTPGCLCHIDVFQISPDGQRIVYAVVRDGWNTLSPGLFSVSSEGGPAQHLAGPFAPYCLRGVMISPDSGYVLYFADKSSGNHNTWSLFSVPAEGGASVELQPGFAAIWGGIHDVQISPDGQWVIYQVTTYESDQSGLYVIPIGGGPALMLSGERLAGGLLLTPDSRQVVYGMVDDFGLTHLRRVPISGGLPVELAAGIITEFRLGVDGQRVLFLSWAGSRRELRAVPVFGGMPVTLNGPLPEGGAVTTFALVSTGQVVYLADQDRQGRLELYATLDWPRFYLPLVMRP